MGTVVEAIWGASKPGSWSIRLSPTGRACVLAGSGESG